VTAPFRRTTNCPNCNYDIPLEDTFSQWVRNHQQLRSGDGFAFMDKDLICHRFKTDHDRSIQYLMFVEVKTRGAKLLDSQRDTMWIVKQLLSNRRITPTKDKNPLQVNGVPTKVKSYMAKTDVLIRAFGYHTLRLSGSTPDDSDAIIWDTTPITREQVVGLLRFDLNPDNFNTMDNRSHHKRKEIELPLWQRTRP
jgi:hypothetical protein